jgi:hypothetical protein
VALAGRIRVDAHAHVVVASPAAHQRHSRRLAALEQFLAVSGVLLARSMFRDAGQIMDDDDDARRSQKFVPTIIRVIILVALISYAIWILSSAFASTKR